MDGMGMGLLLAQAADKATQSPSVPWQFFATVALVFIAPFILGQALATALRLKDLGFKMGIVLFSIFLSAAPFVYQALQGKPISKAIQLGIDLAGGTNLIYAVDHVKASADQKRVDKATLDKMVGAVAKRINPSGAEEVTVRRVGTDRIEVIIPGADREVVEQKKRQIVNLGSLEFAILANQKDHANEIAIGREMRPDQNNYFRDGRLVLSWRDIAPGQEVNQQRDDRTAVREVDRTVDGKTVKARQFLVVHDPPNQAVTGRYLTHAQAQMDESGQLAVGFNFSARGGQLFSQLTDRYKPDKTEGFDRRLAVLLNGEIQTAPAIRSRIGDRGQITGTFTREEIDQLISVLNAGALEVPLIETPVSEFTISPLLGVDVQTKGVRAIIISAIVVFGFMLIYYRGAGVVASLCLILNLITVIGAMCLIEATFTLPGLAGLVLTIGMAVDSNVLIHERMREELARGASLRMAIENGFDKALSAIIDGNVTSLITAVILYMIGSDQIRGFAISLFIGLMLSMFSVLFFGHMLFQIIERKRWAKTFYMMQFLGETKLDFLRTKGIAFALSALVIVAGFLAMFARGVDNLDIDFTGGTLVTFEFVGPQQTDKVKDKLVETFKAKEIGTTISLERLVLANEQTTTEGGHRFRVRTTEKDQAKVTQAMTEAFSDPSMALVRVTMEPTEPVAIAADAKTESGEDRFAGGSQAKLKFSNGLGTASAAAYLADELRRIPGDKEGTSKYDAASGLIEVDGDVAAEKDVAATTTAEKYTEMTAKAVSQIDQADFATALNAMAARMASNPAFEEVNSFDTSVAVETQRDAIIAMLASLVMIVIYIWFRFENLYFGFAAVVALFHDVVVTLVSVCLAAWLYGTPIGTILMFEDFKINMALIASLLTIIGYSMNDTIVIFDRLREIRGRNPNISYDMINLSVNQTLSRTLLTALSTFLVVVILYFFGGSGIHGFAFSMIVGVITGCYSTVYIANPVLYWLISRQQKKASTPVKPPTVPAATTA
ncbi:MAG TPA: protein translocase subunit SecD [Planctomycetaceae bacterium]|nr:protein translocase subunit SecD [Planctomycetaceae bacterium]